MKGQKIPPKNELEETIALFRYEIIAPIVSGFFQGTKEEFYRDASKVEYTLPDGRRRKFSPPAIKKWYLAYQKGGLAALNDQERKDAGVSKRITPKLVKEIDTRLKKAPKISGQKLWEDLCSDGFFSPTTMSVDTIQRYIQKVGRPISDEDNPAEEDRQHLRFEFPNVNDCWQADTVDGPPITLENGTVIQTYLISFIDDKSRKHPASHFYDADNGINVQAVLKEGIRTHGIPKILMIDRGSPYCNTQMRYICAELGIDLRPLRPYAPRGKGKEERSHRTANQRLIDCTDWSECHSLNDLNKKLEEYKDGYYNSHIVRTTGESPQERFAREFPNARFIEDEKLDIIFMHRASRECDVCATIQFNTLMWQLPDSYKNQTVKFRYDPTDLSKIYLVDDKEKKIIHTISPMSVAELNANTKKKRKVIYRNVADPEPLDTDEECIIDYTMMEMAIDYTEFAEKED